VRIGKSKREKRDERKYVSGRRAGVARASGGLAQALNGPPQWRQVSTSLLKTWRMSQPQRLRGPSGATPRADAS